MSQARQRRFHLWGWVLFVLSAMCYIIASLRADDPVGLAGGLLFLLACLVFLIPLLAELSNLSKRRRYFRYPQGLSRAARS